MKRWLLKLTLFLLLGAIVNVAVAWGCVHYATKSFDGVQVGFPSSEDAWLASFGWNPSGFTTESPHEIANPTQPKHWKARDPLSVAATPYGWLDQWSLPYLGHEIRRFDWTRRDQQYAFPPIAYQFRAGLPFRALYGDCHIEAAGPHEYQQPRNEIYTFKHVWRGDGMTTNVPVVPVLNEHGSFPLLPIWPGFAINTVFYGATLWLLLAALFALRRHMRLKRGLCPACAYPIGESPVCTECGKPVKPKALGV